MLSVDWQGCAPAMAWAIAAFDADGNLEAAAKGRPPSWSSGIYGAELWSVLMAVYSSMPGAPIRADCLSVQQGIAASSGLEHQIVSWLERGLRLRPP